MKSIQKRVQNSLERMEKSRLAKLATMSNKGQIIDTATTVIVSLFVLVLIAFAILFGISALNPGSFFTTGSAEQAAVNLSIANFTKGIENFFAQIPAAMKILGVVLIIGFLALLIVIVVRFRSQASGGGGGL